MIHVATKTAICGAFYLSNNNFCLPESLVFADPRWRGRVVRALLTSSFSLILYDPKHVLLP